MPRNAGVSVSIFLVSAMTLMIEILLIRVIDVVLLPNTGYVVITCAMFALGLAGAWSSVFPIDGSKDVRVRLGMLTLLFAAAIAVMRPAMNIAPDLYQMLPQGFARYAIGLGMIYLILLVPFFFAGLIFAYCFSAYPERIRSLYFFDLLGAAFGCIVWIPFIRDFGPGGLLLFGAAILVATGAIFLADRRALFPAAAVASVLIAIPFVLDDDRLDFMEHREKRGVLSARKAGKIEFSEWDPISKIDVVPLDPIVLENGEKVPGWKHIAYDGGSQSSHFVPFDGDLEAIGAGALTDPDIMAWNFWRRGVASSHFVKRGTRPRVLIFGSAGGQEIKAALSFDASHVDGIELVGTVVRLGKEEYADFTGRYLLDPRLNNVRSEGRSFLRASGATWDIIQIFSNHTSSNIATGNGAAAPNYLQTADAYEEYFTHLEEDGILHINHHFYPRMVTTAALAWSRLGRQNFRDHVVIYEEPGADTLPTMLIKMSPWTDRELDDLEQFFAVVDPRREFASIVENPRDHASGFLSDEFFTGQFSKTTAESLDYVALPSTDDWPFFNSIQMSLRSVEPDPDRFLNPSMVAAINGRVARPFGEYAMFLMVGAFGLVVGLILIFAPLYFSEAGRDAWSGKYASVAYFSCLGAGFIVIELILVQVLMKLIGFPIYAYAIVIFTILVAAAVGSLTAELIDLRRPRLWALPFAGVAVTGLVFWLTYPTVTDALLAASFPARIAASMALLAPMGFFMGMPFPLGILSLSNGPQGAIAWAWGMNGLFTVLGGTLSGVLAITLGFRLTLVPAFLVYLVALLLFTRLRAGFVERET